MTTLPALPPELWRLRDAAIEHVLNDAPLPPDFERLHEWFEVDGWDAVVAAWDDGDEMALKFDDFVNQYLSDNDIRDWEGLDESDPITDAMRIEFFRARIDWIISGNNEYIMPSVHSCKVERGDGKSAVIGYTVEIHGQGGPVLVYQGVCLTREAFDEHLRKSGFRLCREVETLDDAGILDVWREVQG